MDIRPSVVRSRATKCRFTTRRDATWRKRWIAFFAPATPRFDRADPSYVCHSEDTYKAGYVAAAAGFPEVTVPAGRISADMPVGFSFMGLPYGEAQLLKLASAFQIAVPPPRALLDSPAR